MLAELIFALLFGALSFVIYQKLFAHKLQLPTHDKQQKHSKFDLAIKLDLILQHTGM